MTTDNRPRVQDVTDFVKTKNYFLNDPTAVRNNNGNDIIIAQTNKKSNQ